MKALPVPPPAEGTVAYVAPFAVFVVLLGLSDVLSLNTSWEYPLRLALVSGAVLCCSPRSLSWRPVRPIGSIALGLLVFAIWITPDLLWPSYRTHWVFENALTGQVNPGLGDSLQQNWVFLAVRTVGAAAVVPVCEELFWRGWLMRYLIRTEFQRVPMGAYGPSAFWLTAALFATEHGPFWDVGLTAGVMYNLWIVYTRSLASCILAHSVSNAALSAYVMASGNWQYW